VVSWVGSCAFFVCGLVVIGGGGRRIGVLAGESVKYYFAKKAGSVRWFCRV
jgi:hypothetical protein